MLQTIAGRVVLAWGWRRALIAMAAGALAALAQAPYFWFPVLFVSLPILVWLIDGAVDPRGRRGLGRLRPAFGVGWCFGFGYFLSGLWWVGAAFLVDADQYGWLMPFAVLALPAGLGLYFGLGAALARLIWSDNSSRIVALALALTATEYLRAHALTGFPWNELGYGLAANTVLMQAASLIGLHGLTFFAVLIFAGPAALAGGARGGVAMTAVSILLLAAIAGFGAWRLAGTETSYVAGVKLRLMQPAIEQGQKWRPEYKTEIINRYLELSARSASDAAPGLTGITHLIWPESAFPFLLANEPWALASVGSLLPENTVLLTGAVRAEPPAAGETLPRYYNSILVIRSGGQILSAYDKVHLVPFGEYLPAQDLLESIGLRQLTKLRGGFSSGPAHRTLEIPGAPPAAALVCYEIIFQGEIAGDGPRPGWLLNVTNDAWFGVTPGPHQHFHQARLRAVEEGLPIVRDANSGISAVVDPWGRVVASLALGKAGILDAGLPNAAEATFYSRYRDRALLVLMLLAAVFVTYRQITISR